jgi:hypothetical protein
MLFHFTFKNYFDKNPIDCVTIVTGDFSVNTLTNTSQSMILQNIMNKYGLKTFLSFEITTIYNT